MRVPPSITPPRRPPPSAGDDVRTLWRHNVELEKRLGWMANELVALRSLIAGKPELWAEFHPFQIYQLPYGIRTTPDPTTDWRKFRIRAGSVNVNATSGTDGRDTAPDAEEVAEADVADITVPDATALYWFWIDCSTLSTPIIDHGADGTEPEWGQLYIPIGTVDTLTETANKRAIIRQYVRTDLFICPTE